jgi:hypothetical protein
VKSCIFGIHVRSSPPCIIESNEFLGWVRYPPGLNAFDVAVHIGSLKQLTSANLKLFSENSLAETSYDFSEAQYLVIESCLMLPKHNNFRLP